MAYRFYGWETASVTDRTGRTPCAYYDLLSKAWCAETCAPRMRDRWTPETAATATYPRLTTESGSNNNTTSDFWMYSTDRVNLAKVQLTYDFPTQWFHKTPIRGLSAYVSGSNLLTIAKERKLLELNVGSAPQTRFYNLGVKVSF